MDALLTYLKRSVPLLVSVGILLAATLLPGFLEVVPPFWYTLVWFLLGGALGAWAFREAYKGGPDNLTLRAIQKREEAARSARRHLAQDEVRQAYAVLAPYAQDGGITDIHLVLARTLLRLGRQEAVREMLFTRKDALVNLPVERLRNWEPLFKEAGEQDAFLQLARDKFRESPSVYLVELITGRFLAEQRFDELLEWADPYLQNPLDDEASHTQLLRAVLRAVTETCDANLRLGLAPDNVALLASYESTLQTEALWQKNQVDTLLALEQTDEAIEAALNGYRLTANPALLQEAFRALLSNSEPASALARFVEWIDLFPNDGLYRFYIGWVLFHIGRLQDAMPHIEAALKQDGPHRYFALITRSMIDVALHDTGSALAALGIANHWVHKVPFLWECGTCGLIGEAPETVCKRCGTWNQYTVVAMPDTPIDGGTP